MDSPNLERGIQLFEIGRYKDAISYFQSALSENVNNTTAKYFLAQCLFQTGALDKALNLALDLRRDIPDAAHVYFLLSQLYLHQKKIKEAEENIDKSIALDPYQDTSFGQKAYIELSKKKFEDALKSANEGLRLNPKSNFCLNARTTALTKLNRKDEAKSSIEHLLEDDPEDAHSHANVGWSYLEHNNTKDALNHFKEALSLNPNLEYARSGMLTAIKSKNKVYNLYLRYSFWMNKQSGKNQWIFIIGIYIAYKLSVKLISASGYTFLLIPLIIIYLLFALGSWIMEPLSNMLLILDKYGKYLLDQKEKLSGQVFFALLIGALVMFLCNIATKNDYFTMLSLTCLAAILPLTRGVLANTKKSKIINLAYGGVMIFAAIGLTLFGGTIAQIGITVGVMFIAYTWLSNFFTS
ncbi:tetratricopeptide repeat protein [Algibacter miyuki]|uniref:Tetratricopeptide repeat protein n=1 Tax=Algibacter miyuki TaxID=1306933 RepID=A0ABV5GXF7_9FLAO|nr:tetratricopeptide repeat protein [Algibacter miyuki]MDN3665962.1 tetratricopeptide repeat protein [Algibacter miyuki]